MATLDIKKDLHHQIDEINDNDFLKVLQTVISGYQNKEAVGNIGGKSLTNFDIIQREIEALKDIESGNVLTLNDIKAKYGKK